MPTDNNPQDTTATQVPVADANPTPIVPAVDSSAAVVNPTPVVTEPAITQEQDATQAPVAEQSATVTETPAAPADDTTTNTGGTV